mgnify:CR=1 FL=1
MTVSSDDDELIKFKLINGLSMHRGKRRSREKRERRGKNEEETYTMTLWLLPKAAIRALPPPPFTGSAAVAFCKLEQHSSGLCNCSFTG